jgi:hypothetical protein
MAGYRETSLFDSRIRLALPCDTRKSSLLNTILCTIIILPILSEKQPTGLPVLHILNQKQRSDVYHAGVSVNTTLNGMIQISALRITVSGYSSVCIVSRKIPLSPNSSVKRIRVQCSWRWHGRGGHCRGKEGSHIVSRNTHCRGVDDLQ